MSFTYDPELKELQVTGEFTREELSEAIISKAVRVLHLKSALNRPRTAVPIPVGELEQLLVIDSEVDLQLFGIERQPRFRSLTIQGSPSAVDSLCHSTAIQVEKLFLREISNTSGLYNWLNKQKKIKSFEFSFASQGVESLAAVSPTHLLELRLHNTDFNGKLAKTLRPFDTLLYLSISGVPLPENALATFSKLFPNLIELAAHDVSLPALALDRLIKSFAKLKIAKTDYPEQDIGGDLPFLYRYQLYRI